MSEERRPRASRWGRNGLGGLIIILIIILGIDEGDVEAL